MSDGSTVVVDAVLNCTGPASLRDPVRIGLVDRLVTAGVVTLHRMDQGLEHRGGRALSSDGTIHKGLHLVGPLRRGVGWETTAVPEIRVQAATTAAAIVAELAGTDAATSHRAVQPV